MRTSTSNLGSRWKISLAICSPSNSRSWRDEHSSRTGQNTTVEIARLILHFESRALFFLASLIRYGFLASDVLLKRATREIQDRKSTRLNSSHVAISYAVFCLKKKKESRLESKKALTSSL